MIALLLLLPLLAALAAVLFGSNDRWHGYVAVAGSVASLSMLPFVSQGSSSINWFSISSYTFDIGILVMPLNMLLLGITLIIAPFVLAYSLGFIAVRSERRRFYAEMLVFEASMLLFAMSGSFITFLIAWEFLSISSYLLIGFWHWKSRARRAARKALTVVLLGDLSILLSMAIFFNIYGTLNFTGIMNGMKSASPMLLYPAALLLLIAILTKSAQFPFQNWLPDAMEGPAPVSAFLHSTTMVKAGVFSAIIFLPLFAYTGITRVIFVLSAVTVVIATMNAMKETHIKKIIAQSTIQELGLMLMAISSGALLAAVYFFIVQSFYKALLFFSAGAVMDASNSEDIRHASGMRSNTALYASTLLAVLSLAGFIPFSSFFFNTALDTYFTSNMAIYAVLTLISVMTSFYIFRWFLLGSKKPDDSGVSARYVSLPKSMTYSSAALGILTLASSLSFFAVRGFLSSALPSYLSVFWRQGSTAVPGFLEAALETALVSLGAIASYVAYRRGIAAPHGLAGIFSSEVAFSGIYSAFAGFMCGISEGAMLLEAHINTFFDSFGKLAVASGAQLRKAAVGSINVYAVIMALCLLAFLAFGYAYVTGVI